MSIVVDPVIIRATVAAGHDGQAEVAIDLRYPNGAVRSVSFAYETIAPALDANHIAGFDDLVGRPWTFLVADQRDLHTPSTETGT